MTAGEPLTLLILAGGASSRMGRDKVSLPFPLKTDPPLIRRVHDRLRPLATACLVAGREQFGLDCQLVADLTDLPGPLGGLVAGLLDAPTELVLAAAADTPFALPGLAAQLVALAASHQQAEAVVCVRASQLEPLFAVYRRSAAAGLAAVREGRHGGRGASLRRALELLQLLTVAESVWRQWDPDASSFRSCNTPQELAEAVRSASTSHQGGNL